KRINTNSYPQVNIYPNPANEKIIVSLNNLDADNVSVYDYTGRMIYQKQLATGQNNIIIDCGSWHQGVYLLNASNKNLTKTISQKFVKNN
ncbi:MAG: hypothetical protein JWQ09_3779, partial [Segetibacter sp.]|nr:hypothetical protein [Segetibacter sp.]